MNPAYSSVSIGTIHNSYFFVPEIGHILKMSSEDYVYSDTNSDHWSAVYPEWCCNFNEHLNGINTLTNIAECETRTVLMITSILESRLLSDRTRSWFLLDVTDGVDTAYAILEDAATNAFGEDVDQGDIEDFLLFVYKCEEVDRDADNIPYYQMNSFEIVEGGRNFRIVEIEVQDHESTEVEDNST